MNKELKKILQSLGLAKEEVDVYLAGLELGEDSVQNIARKAGVKRPTTYKILASLMNKGMFYQTLKGKKRFFSAENPTKLQTTIKQKEIALAQILPELKSIYNLDKIKPKVKFYEGVSGAIAVYEDALSSTEEGGEILNYTGIRNLYDVFPEGYVKEYFRKRVAKNIKAKVIAVDSKESREWRANAEKELREIILVPEEKFNFLGDTEIYGNKVALFSYQENCMVVVIESEIIANMQRFIFNLAWSNLSI